MTYRKIITEKDLANGTKAGVVNPITSTSEMTQPVGVDSTGKLLTKPAKERAIISVSISSSPSPGAIVTTLSLDKVTLLDTNTDSIIMLNNTSGLSETYYRVIDYPASTNYILFLSAVKNGQIKYLSLNKTSGQLKYETFIPQVDTVLTFSSVPSTITSTQFDSLKNDRNSRIVILGSNNVNDTIYYRSNYDASTSPSHLYFMSVYNNLVSILEITKPSSGSIIVKQSSSKYNWSTETSANTSSISTLRTQQDTLQTNVNTLQTNVGNLQTSVSTLQTNVGTLQTNVANLQTKQNTLEQNLNKKLSLPTTAPTDNVIVAVNSSNVQTNLTLGEGLKIENNTISSTATGGTATEAIPVETVDAVAQEIFGV